MYYTTVSSATSMTPYLMFGRECNIPTGKFFEKLCNEIPTGQNREDIEGYAHKLVKSCSIRDDISRNSHVNVGNSLGSIRTLTVTPCVEVVAVWTVPGAVSPGCILAEHRKGDTLTPGGNESGGFGAKKRKGNVGNFSCMNPSMLRQCGKIGAISCFV